MNSGDVLPIVMFAIAAAAVIIAAIAVVRHSAPGMPDGASKLRYRLFASGFTLIAGGVALQAFAEMKLSIPQVGLIGSVVTLAGLGTALSSTRALLH